MRAIVLVIALLLPAGASAQITMYRPNAYGSHLYQFGPRGTSITTTIPNGYGGFNQYHYGPGRAPAFVQPLPTPSYNYGYNQGGYGFNPGYGGYNYGGYQPYAPPVYRPRPYWGMGAW